MNKADAKDWLLNHRTDIGELVPNDAIYPLRLLNLDKFLDLVEYTITKSGKSITEVCAAFAKNKVAVAAAFPFIDSAIDLFIEKAPERLHNTDNAGQSDCSLKVEAEVVGNTSYDERRKNGDNRKTVFTVELPDQADEFCEVRLVEHGHKLAALARFGVALCLVKGIGQIAEGEEKQGKMTIKAAKKILAELEAEKGKFPTVILPGGVSLQHALACVQIVNGLINDQPKN